MNENPAESGEANELPEIGDLVEQLKFAPTEGRIWMRNHRGILLSATAFGSIRSKIIEEEGLDEARSTFARIGYAEGARDAAAARRLRPKDSPRAVFAAGPQAHALYGFGWSEVVSLRMEPDRGIYFFEFLVHDSAEANIHLESYGPSVEPVCWMACGYGSGFTSAFAGRPCLVKEVECRGMGAPACRLVGKPVDEWDIEESDTNLYTIGPYVNRFDIAEDEQKASDVIGISAGFATAYHRLSKAAPSKATLLFLGETGVGKEVFARLAHQLSPRKDKPFVAVNCGALPESLIESELFGVVRGGFTGASSSRAGRFERADGGTLFLDEIGTLSLSAQAKLLRTLQEQEIERIGDTEVKKVDVRVLAATNIDLKQAVRNGEFREDLYFRIAPFPIRIPPLRERRDDIPLLMEHFKQRYCTAHDRRIPGFTTRAVESLLLYSLPGNIRELEHRIEGAVLMATEHEPIDILHLFPDEDAELATMLSVNPEGRLKAMSAPDLRQGVEALLAATENRPDTFRAIEQALVNAVIEHTGGNLAAAARRLGLSRKQVDLRLKKAKPGPD